MSQDPFDRAVQRIEAREQEHRQQKRVRRQALSRRGLRVHAGVFAATQLLLFAIWASVALAAGVIFPWFIFPLLGWGIGLVAHWVGTRPVDATQTG